MDAESLTGIYREIAKAISVDVAIELHKLFRGQQIIFPQRLYDQEYIEEYVKSHKTFSFRVLLEKQRSRMELIVTFLVVLEMMKTGLISIVQEEIFDDIMITSNVA